MDQAISSHFAFDDAAQDAARICVMGIGGGNAVNNMIDNGTIRHTAVIAVAGNKVTDDLRKGLGVMRVQAEALKCRFGIALADLVEQDEDIRIPSIGERPENGFSRSTLAQVIQPRMEETLEIAAIEIKRSGYARHLAGGLVEEVLDKYSRAKDQMFLYTDIPRRHSYQPLTGK